MRTTPDFLKSRRLFLSAAVGAIAAGVLVMTLEANADDAAQDRPDDDACGKHEKRIGRSGRFRNSRNRDIGDKEGKRHGAHGRSHIADHVHCGRYGTRSRAADVHAGIKAGADDYITKPFDEAGLRAKLDKLGRG